MAFVASYSNNVAVLHRFPDIITFL